MIPSPATTLEVAIEHKVGPNLSLSVEFQLGREIGVLFGQSGAGKSTLLRLIAGLTRPDSGRIVLDGEVLYDSRARHDAPLWRRGIGMIYQDDLLFPHLSVRENIAFGLAGWSRPGAADRVREVAGLCGVERLLDRRPAMLSGGERQRVGLARAVAPGPRLLLCDEPFSALDLGRRSVLITRLIDLHRSQGIPILHVTHSPSEAVALGGTMLMLDQGRITAVGPPIELLAGQRRPSIPWTPLANVFHAVLEGPLADEGGSLLVLEGGLKLVVPGLDKPAGSAVLVQVRADDILLARGAIPGLSARNQLAGIVERVLSHDHEVEVVVRAGGLAFLVSLVAAAARQLEITAGADVVLIIKARSCRVLEEDESTPAPT